MRRATCQPGPSGAGSVSAGPQGGRRFRFRLLDVAVVVLGWAVAVVGVLGGLVADLRSFAGGPWDDRPGGLLARACEGSGIAALFGLPPALGLAAVGWGTAGWFGVRRRGRVAGLCGLTGLAVAVLGGPAAGAAYQRRAEAVRWRAAASLSVPTVNDWDRLYFGPVPPAFRRPDAWPAALGLVVDRNRSANALCEVADRVRRDRTDEAHGVRRRALAELERRADGADADDLVDLVAAACRRRDDPDLTRLKHRAAERLAVAAETHPDRFLLSHLVADVWRHGWEDDPDCRRLVAVWRRRVD